MNEEEVRAAALQAAATMLGGSLSFIDSEEELSAMLAEQRKIVFELAEAFVRYIRNT